MKYFDEESVARQVLFWSVGARRHLELWEERVASWIRVNLKDQQAIPDGQLVWAAALDRHLVFVCMRNVLRALDLAKKPPRLERKFTAAIKNVRDLLEHWDENMPVFNVSPRGSPKRKSGQAFAADNPYDTPYGSMSWRSSVGAVLTPDVPASAMHASLDQLESWAVGVNPALVDYVPSRRESPWIHTDSGEWWPRDLHTQEGP